MKTNIYCLCLGLLWAGFSACDRGDTATATETEPSRTASLKITRYVAGIEVGSSGPRGEIIGLGTLANGTTGYEVSQRLDSPGSTEDFADDGGVNAAETELLLKEIDQQVNQIKASGLDVTATYLIFSIAYAKAANMTALKERIRLRYPGMDVAQITPELEATANYLTMQGRVDLDFSDFILVDIGGSSTIVSVFDYPTDSVARAEPLRYGSRSTLELIDPLSDFTVRRPNDRKRMDDMVREMAEVEIKTILRQRDFSRRKKVVLVGGLVYKIIRVLDVPLTGTLIDFSRNSSGDPVYRFMDALLDDDAGLERGPDYRREEMYTALRMLGIITAELADSESVYFFERPSWIPGYVLFREQAK